MRIILGRADGSTIIHQASKLAATRSIPAKTLLLDLHTLTAGPSTFLSFMLSKCSATRLTTKYCKLYTFECVTKTELRLFVDS